MSSITNIGSNINKFQPKGFTKTPKAQAIHRRITKQEEKVQKAKQTFREEGPLPLNRLGEELNKIKTNSPSNNKAFSHVLENYMKPIENIQKQIGKVSNNKLEQRLNTIITKDLPHRALGLMKR